MNGQARLKHPEFLLVSGVILPTRHHGCTHPYSCAFTQLPKRTCVLDPNTSPQVSSQPSSHAAGRHPHIKAWPLVSSASTAEDRIDAWSMRRCSAREHALSRFKGYFCCWLACALCEVQPLLRNGFEQAQFFRRDSAVAELPDKTIQVPKGELCNCRVHNVQSSHDQTFIPFSHSRTNGLQIGNRGTRHVITSRRMPKSITSCAREPQVGGDWQFEEVRAKEPR